MTDMTAFERQLSGEIAGLMGPVRPVDDLAIFESAIAANRQKGWGFTMFSALKFIAASVIVALFGGFLLTGVLTTQQGDEIAPAAATESPSTMRTEEPSSDVDAFPSGHFVSEETGRVMLEFTGDETGMTHSASLGSATPFTYAVDGDIYTALRGPWEKVIGIALVDADQPSGWATYRWDHDGERLAFELMGEDRSDRRKALLVNATFRSIEDPVVVMVATSDLDVGDPIRAWLAFVPAADAGLDAYTSKAEYPGRVAAVPIAKGQPITPDLLEPAE